MHEKKGLIHEPFFYGIGRGLSLLSERIEKIGSVKSASVEKHTGKSWSEWIAILQKAQAQNWPHREAKLWLKQKYKLSPWWQSGVAMGYEIFIGRRVEGRNEKGEYSLTVTKTLPASQKRAWKFISSPEGSEVWLKPFAPFALKPKAAYEVDGGIFGEVRTMKAPLRARLTWQDENWEKASVVQIHLMPRPGEKCMIGIQHEKLPSNALRDKMRAHWKAAATRLLEALAEA